VITRYRSFQSSIGLLAIALSNLQLDYSLSLVNPLGVAAKYSKAKLLRIFCLFCYYNTYKSELLTL